MTFEEIREMVNATINENGKREITGKAINLALLETLTAIEEFLANNKPEGGGVETVYIETTLTAEHQAANAAVYAKCAAAVAEGKPLPGIQADITSILVANAGSSEGLGVVSYADDVMFLAKDSPLATQMQGLILQVDSAFLGGSEQIVVNEDGSLLLPQ